MILFEEALKLVLDSAWKLGHEEVALEDAPGRVLAADVFADVDMPPFHKATVDGYACRRSDLPWPLSLREVVAAGKMPEKEVQPGTCSKIMTGAPVPEGSDCVVMSEDTETLPDGRIRFTGSRTKDNIAFRAEDVKAGSLVLAKGTGIRPQHVAVMAAVGYVRPLVSSRPKIGVLVTGDELVEPAIRPVPPAIRNSNGSQLTAQASGAGADAKYYGIIADEEDRTLEAVRQAKEENDVILISGGVSLGDFDFVPGVLQKAGFNLLIRNIAIQPGKPTVFGLSGRKACFGLPGNPVSTFVLFEILVKPFLAALTGLEFKALLSGKTLQKDIYRKNASRQSFIPVKTGPDDTVIPLEYHGSAHIHSLAEADGLISIPIGVGEVLKGNKVYVRQI